VRRTYNRAEHLTDRARMMQQWANLLNEWQRGDNKVHPLRQKRAAVLPCHSFIVRDANTA